MNRIIELPDNMFVFGKVNCSECPNRDCPGLEETKEFCPIANSIKAVEITTDHMETYQGEDTGRQTINGKRVKLWATDK